MITVDNRDQPVTVVAFSGLAPRNSMFEWVKSCADLPCNFVGVRDPANDWYQTKRDAVAWEVERHAPRPRVFIGASAGGFAALMFGGLINADRVLAISPQSACGQTKRDLGDTRWPEFCDHTSAHDIGGMHPGATIYYAVDEPLDIMHAHRLDCRCEAYPVGGHNLAGRLKERGLIGGIIADAVRAVA